MHETTKKRRKPPVRKPHPIHRRDYAQFRALLLEWRTGAGLSQRAMAKKLNRSPPWVNRCETGGRRLDPLEWMEWLSACGVDPVAGLRQLARRL